MIKKLGQLILIFLFVTVGSTKTETQAIKSCIGRIQSNCSNSCEWKNKKCRTKTKKHNEMSHEHSLHQADQISLAKNGAHSKNIYLQENKNASTAVTSSNINNTNIVSGSVTNNTNQLMQVLFYDDKEIQIPTQTKPFTPIDGLIARGAQNKIKIPYNANSVSVSSLNQYFELTLQLDHIVINPETSYFVTSENKQWIISTTDLLANNSTLTNNCPFAIVATFTQEDDSDMPTITEEIVPDQKILIPTACKGIATEFHHKINENIYTEGALTNYTNIEKHSSYSINCSWKINKDGYSIEILNPITNEYEEEEGSFSYRHTALITINNGIVLSAQAIFKDENGKILPHTSSPADKSNPFEINTLHINVPAHAKSVIITSKLKDIGDSPITSIDPHGSYDVSIVGKLIKDLQH